MAGLNRASAEATIVALNRWPVNPTHHFWRVLATRFGFPFLKTELIRHNPSGLPAVTEWQTLVPADSPCPLTMMRAHLATLDASSGIDQR
jgi:hypothetical protein